MGFDQYGIQPPEFEEFGEFYEFEGILDIEESDESEIHAWCEPLGALNDILEKNPKLLKGMSKN